MAAKITAARRYVLANPRSAHAWGVLGMSLDVHGYRDEALECYRSASVLAPDDFRWPYYAAIAQAEAKPAEAAAGFERAGALLPGYAPLEVRRGEALLAAGDPAAADRAFAAAAEADPGLSHAALGRARVALARGDLEAALGFARRAAELAPAHAEAHGLLAEIHRRLGEPEEARRQLLAARRLPEATPLPDPVYSALAREGVSSFWHRRRGRALLEAGDARPAAEELRLALAAAPSAEAHDDLGLALQQLGEPAAAVEQHRAALALRPRFAGALANLAAALAETGAEDEAAAAAERALEIDPAETAAALTLGTLHQRAGRRRAAAAAFRRGLEHAPDDLRLVSRLAWLLATAPEDDLRDGAEAVRLAERACERTGYRLAAAVDVLAAAYAEAGRFEQSVAAADRALALAAAAGDAGLETEIAARRRLYQSQTPYREGAP